MKKEIIKKEKGLVFTVKFTPNWLERLFGYQTKIKKFGTDGTICGWNGNGWLLYDLQTNEKYGHIKIIDNYINSFE
jgi:hypothetical protein